MTDPFELLGERTISSPVKARMRAAAERAKRKVLAERDLLHKQWKKWHDECLQEFLNGPHKQAAKELHSFLENMSNAGGLLIEKAKIWRGADKNTKYQVLRMIDRACIYLNEKNGLDPFSDDLNDPPTTAFLLIREMLQ